MFNKFKLTKFCTENRGLLLQLAYSWCHDQALAEDLVQDATEKAFKNISRIKHTLALKAWFIQIMLNCWRDTLRKKQDHQNIDDLIFSDSTAINESHYLDENPSPEQRLSAQQSQTEVQSAMSRLPIKYRTVLTLVDIYGTTYSEVAHIVGVPVGTIMSRISRARQELLKNLSTNDPQQLKVVSIHNKTVVRGEE